MKFKEIPPDSFIVVSVQNIEEFEKSGAADELAEYFEENNCRGIFISPGFDLQVLDDNELAKLGLQRRDRH